jgi:hypothetical protein
MALMWINRGAGNDRSEQGPLTALTALGLAQPQSNLRNAPHLCADHRDGLNFAGMIVTPLAGWP